MESRKFERVMSYELGVMSWGVGVGCVGVGV